MFPTDKANYKHVHSNPFLPNGHIWETKGTEHLINVRKNPLLPISNEHGIVQEIQGVGLHNKTISDGGITVDFSIIKVHTSN